MEKSDAVLLEKRDNVYYLYLNKPKANNFDTAFVRQINEKLDIVEKDPNICALVTTSALEKIFSSGLDLKYIASLKYKQDVSNFTLEVLQLFGRLLVFPVPTIALINGITMAAGFMFAIAQDYRFIVSDKAWICLNEVDMGVPLVAGPTALVQSKVSPRAYRELFLTGRRIEPKEAKELELVDFMYDKEEIAEKVHQFANELAEKSSDKDNFKALKMEAYLDAYTKCTDRKFGTHQGIHRWTLGKL